MRKFRRCEEKSYSYDVVLSTEKKDAESDNDDDVTGNNPEKEGEDKDSMDNKGDKFDETTNKNNSSSSDYAMKEEDLPAID